MEQSDFYSDKKFCPACQEYVSYLMGLEHSYCVHCGERVRLFSKDDWHDFHEGLARGRTKPGRPARKERGKESA